MIRELHQLPQRVDEQRPRVHIAQQQTGLSRAVAVEYHGRPWAGQRQMREPRPGDDLVAVIRESRRRDEVDDLVVAGGASGEGGAAASDTPDVMGELCHSGLQP